LLSVAYEASLRENEGRPTRVAIVVENRDVVYGAAKFSRPATFDVATLVKLAPAVPKGDSIGVSVTDGRFSIWGFLRDRPFGTPRAEAGLNQAKPVQGLVMVRVRSGFESRLRHRRSRTWWAFRRYCQVTATPDRRSVQDASRARARLPDTGARSASSSGSSRGPGAPARPRAAPHAWPGGWRRCAGARATG